MATFAFIMLPSSTALWVSIFCSSECCDGDGVIMMIMSVMPINSVHYGRKVVFTGNGNRDSGFEDNLKLSLLI